MKRDIEVTNQLEKEGWIVLRFWDVDINKHLDKCVSIVKETVMKLIV